MYIMELSFYINKFPINAKKSFIKDMMYVISK